MTTQTLKGINFSQIPILSSLARLFSKNNKTNQLADMVTTLVVPVVAFSIFMLLWSFGASQIKTSLGAVPGPAKVWEQTLTLYDEYKEEREKEVAFHERQEKRNAAKLEKNPDAKIRVRPYTGKPTYFDQILTSIVTVATGFIIASLIAIPIGIICGLSPLLYTALNPLIQIFKPVSPLAWLPIVTMIVSAVYISDDPMFEKSYLNSAITVTLCCLWPTIINTTVGVSSIDKDLINVSRVLQLSWLTKVFKIVIPSSIPMMFAGLRVSLGIGWMVLIAAEMLAQNPGLGKFVWDEFQNGSSDSLARIMVAVFSIGLIGFLLDRLMLILQRMMSWDKSAVLR